MVVERGITVVLGMAGVMFEVIRNVYTAGISNPRSEVLDAAENWLGKVL